MKYERGGATLYCADCRDLLPRLGTERLVVDLILTDPPYGVNWRSNRRKERFAPIAGDEDAAVAYAGLATGLAVLRKFRHVYSFGLADFGDLPLSGQCDLIWDKAIIGMGNLSLPWGPQHETIRFGVYAPSKANRDRGDGRLAARLRKGSVLRSQRSNASGVTSPSEKPVDIQREMIESSSCLGEIVLDPFMGYGSSAEAAIREERRYVGIELDPEKWQAAVERVDALLGNNHRPALVTGLAGQARLF